MRQQPFTILHRCLWSRILLTGLFFLSIIGTAEAQVYVYGGTFGSPGLGNGQFEAPTGIAVNSKGNIFVADGSIRIQKFDKNGNYLKTLNLDTVAAFPCLATDSNDNLYVGGGLDGVDKFDSNDNYVGVAAFPVSQGAFLRVTSLAIDNNSNIFIQAGSIIQKFDGKGNFVTQFGSLGNTLGTASLTVDKLGNVFAVASQNGIYSIQKFGNNGSYISSINMDGAGSIVVNKANNHIFAAYYFSLVQYDSEGNVINRASPPPIGWSPAAMAVDSSSNIFAADNGGFRVIKYRSTSPVIQPDKSLGGSCDYDGEVFVGEPINVGTGNVYDETTDYETLGPNKLSFIRYYNSLAKINSVPPALGQNWHSNYDRQLTILPSLIVYVARADGQGLQFNAVGANWISDSDVRLKLTQLGNTWTLTNADDSVETYITNGNSGKAILTSIRARNGYIQTLNYGANNQVASVTDSYNRTLSFTYQNGLLQTVTTPDHLVLTYNYDASGVTSGTPDRLRTVAYSTTPQTGKTYLYENANLPLALTGIIDENGNRFASWMYDQSGRGLASQFGMGASLTMVAYNDTDGSRTVTHALGQQEVYHFATLQGVPKVTEINRSATVATAAATKTSSYDANGYLASESDWNGNTTNYVNDASGRMTVMTEAFGTPDERPTTISYFQNYHLPARIVASNLTSTFGYDANANLLTKMLTDTTTTTNPYSTTGQNRTWTFTWANGLLTSVQNPRRDVNAFTIFTYDGSSTLVKTTNALGQTIQVTQHTPGGLPLTIVDANGVVTKLTYDARLRLTSSALNTSKGLLTTQYSYDPAGNLLTLTLPDGSAIANTYDIAHRLIGMTDLFRQTIGYTLDAAGDRTQVAVADATGTIQRREANTFDALARLTQATRGANQTTQYTYDNDNNVAMFTDPLGHAQTQAFDNLNRLAQNTNAAHSVTAWSYDAQDRPQTVTAPNGAITTYVHDGFGDIIEKISPDSGTTVYNYDADGNQTRKVDATGAVTNYSYDVLDRVTTATYPANVSENVTYAYDQSGRGFGVGRLTTLTDAAGTLQRSYDERGNTLQEARTISGTTLSTAYTYDAVSRIAGITYPSGWTVGYVRDAMGRTTSVTAKAPGGAVQTVASNIGYKPFGPVNSLTFGNNVVETRAFDGSYRLTSLTSVGTHPLQNLGYGYDAADNVLTNTDGVTPQNSQTFGYDTLNRLTGAMGGYGSLAYTYDSVSNRLTQTQGGILTTYSYVPQSNRLTSLTSGGVTQTLGYTAAGNISAAGSSPNLTTTYNQAGRLASVNQPGTKKGNVQYVYDAFGRRLVKLPSAQGQTLYQYDTQNRMLEEKGFTASAVADYIYLDDGRLIATISPSAKSIYYVHSDRLGTPQLATNNAQAVVWSTAYMPFGQTGTVSGAITQDMRLPGQYFDTETGWNQNGFRDYVPALGRYLESDPIGLDGGMNTYAYVNGNPVKNVDLMGLTSFLSRLQEGWTRADNLVGLLGTTIAVSTARGDFATYKALGGSVDFSLGYGTDLYRARLLTEATQTLYRPLLEGWIIEFGAKSLAAATYAVVDPGDDSLDNPFWKAILNFSGYYYPSSDEIATYRKATCPQESIIQPAPQAGFLRWIQSFPNQ